jgi:hypothetical protein
MFFEGGGGGGGGRKGSGGGEGGGRARGAGGGAHVRACGVRARAVWPAPPYCLAPMGVRPLEGALFSDVSGNLSERLGVVGGLFGTQELETARALSAPGKEAIVHYCARLL